MQVEDPLEKLIQKEKAQHNTSWVGLPKFEVFIEPILSKKIGC
jgi:hypothetical protein